MVNVNGRTIARPESYFPENDIMQLFRRGHQIIIACKKNAWKRLSQRCRRRHKIVACDLSRL